MPSTQPQPTNTKPIFYSESLRRWRWFKRGARFVFMLALVLVSFTILALFQQSRVSLPRLYGENEAYKKILNPEHITTFKTKANTDYRSLRKQITAKLSNKAAASQRALALSPGEPVRAGFYVNWDIQSWHSLRDNIEHLNMVLPEWFFVPDEGYSVAATIDERALALMKTHKTRVVPMISNYFNGKWNGKNVHRIISTPAARMQFIASVLDAVEQNDFDGVNIDFEELVESSDENLITFERELAEALHEKGLLVTQSVAPLNEDYDLARLGKSNDLIFLMAYDMHFVTSAPGPIADVNWVANIVRQAQKKVPPQKLILGLAAYGYDWPENGEATDVTYQEAAVTATESEGKIVFDQASSNLTYAYDDDDDRPHQVWFTDAATTFNTMRLAADAQLGGTALWRLGGEDARIWKFYNRDLSTEGLQKSPFNYTLLEESAPSTDIDYQGEGEVLDVVATPTHGKIDVSFDDTALRVADQVYVTPATNYVIRKFGKAPKKILLTFDDGPDADFTPEVLDILKQEQIPATFFLVGINAEANLPLVRRIFSDGHEIGNHTFSHPNLAEVGPDRTMLELNATRRIIESVTGRSTILFRPPFNADSEPETYDEIEPVAVGKAANYYTVGESIDPRDWEQGISAAEIIRRVKEQEKNGSIVLLHDAGGDRTETVKALPEIIHYFKSRGYAFTTVADFIGKSRDDLMPPLKDSSDRMLAQVNWFIAEGVYWGTVFLEILFVGAIILAVVRTLFVAALAWLQYSQQSAARTQRTAAFEAQPHPAVAVIVPAYNEEVTAVQTVRRLLASDYPDLTIIFVDDGSKDQTYEVVKRAFGDDRRVTVIKKVNGGKSSALNVGIAHSSTEIVICIDADTQLAPNAISELVPFFASADVGAVAGNVKVGNARNFLTHWQSIEYVTSQNFDRRAFDLINCITVVPGAIGAFRRSAMQEAGGFSNDTLAEDCDLTIRILRAGYRVRYAETALAYTEAPETLRMFLQQRFRWSFGILQSIWKHRDLIGDPSEPALGLFALPQALVFQFILPCIAPIADAIMLVSLFAGFWEETLSYYLLFTAVDVLGAIIAFRFERENIGRLWMLLPQRFIYRQLMYWVILKSGLMAMRGQLVGWGY